MNSKSQAGFSYIDVMIAIVILMVGVLALLSAITGAVILSSRQENQLRAKQLAASTMESIFSVKESKRVGTILLLGWDKIGNVGTNPDAGGIPRGIFVNGTQPIQVNAGLDQIVGTVDDAGGAVPGFTRQIIITDLCDPDRPSYNCPTPGAFKVKMRMIQVNIFYNSGTIQNQESLTTVLTDYLQDN